MAGFGARWVGQDAAKGRVRLLYYEFRGSRGTPQSHAATWVLILSLMIVNVAVHGRRWCPICGRALLLVLRTISMRLLVCPNFRVCLFNGRIWSDPTYICPVLVHHSHSCSRVPRSCSQRSHPVIPFHLPLCQLAVPSVPSRRVTKISNLSTKAAVL